MDKLAKTLREDAERIEVHVSADLDERLRASIENASSSATHSGTARKPVTRIGWASALTGMALAAALIFVVDFDQADPPDVPSAVVPPLESVTGALPRLNTETALFTAPLTEELENLEADLRKAERAVKREIGLGL